MRHDVAGYPQFVQMWLSQHSL